MTTQVDSRMPPMSQRQRSSKPLLIEQAMDLCKDVNSQKSSSRHWWSSYSPARVRRDATQDVHDKDASLVSDVIKIPSRNASFSRSALPKSSGIANTTTTSLPWPNTPSSSRVRTVKGGKLPTIASHRKENTVDRKPENVVPAPRSVASKKPFASRKSSDGELTKGNDSASGFRRFMKNPLSKFGKKTPDTSNEESSSKASDDKVQKQAPEVPQKQEPEHYDGAEQDQSDGKTVAELQSELWALFNRAKDAGGIVLTSDANLETIHKVLCGDEEPAEDEDVALRPLSARRTASGISSSSTCPGSSPRPPRAALLPASSACLLHSRTSSSSSSWKSKRRCSPLLLAGYADGSELEDADHEDSPEYASLPMKIGASLPIRSR